MGVTRMWSCRASWFVHATYRQGFPEDQYSPKRYAGNTSYKTNAEAYVRKRGWYGMRDPIDF